MLLSSPHRLILGQPYHTEQLMADDLPHWVGHYADMLGCDSFPAAVAVAIENLLSERERQRKAIGRLRGENAALRRTASSGARSGDGESSAILIRLLDRTASAVSQPTKKAAHPDHECSERTASRETARG